MKMNKYLAARIGLLLCCLWLLTGAVGCNEIARSGAANRLGVNVAQMNEGLGSAEDSVNFIILNGVLFDEKGKIIESSIKQAVYNRIQNIPQTPCFLEISSNHASGDWFLFNLEAVRREFVQQGFDPVLVSTHKKIRNFLGEKKPSIGFTVVSAGS